MTSEPFQSMKKFKVVPKPDESSMTPVDRIDNRLIEMEIEILRQFTVPMNFTDFRHNLESIVVKARLECISILGGKSGYEKKS